MDGIFGVGLAEMIIIALALFVIGGPENTAKWARQAGRTIRQAREMWTDFTKDLEKELGPEGKELMDATREISQSAADLRRSTSPRRLLAESTRAMEALARDDAPPARAARPSAEGDSAPADTPAPSERANTVGSDGSDARYRAWQPPQNGQ